MFRRQPTSGVLTPTTGGQNKRKNVLRFTGAIKLPRAYRSDEPREQEERPGAPGPTGNRLGPKAVREHGTARPGVPAFLENSHT